MPENQKPTVYSAAAAAEILNMPEKELAYLVRVRKIGFYKNRRGVATFGSHHIEAYLASIECPPITEQPPGSGKSPAATAGTSTGTTPPDDASAASQHAQRIAKELKEPSGGSSSIVPRDPRRRAASVAQPSTR